MLLQWSKELAVGHPIIDSDHQMLINFANELHHGVHSGAGNEAVGMALGRLAQYIETHFEREEELFMSSKYPNKEKHQQNHRDIEKLVRGFQAAFEADHTSVDMDKLLDFLKEWLVKHIGKLDKSYMPYVKAMEKQQSQFGARRGFV